MYSLPLSTTDRIGLPLHEHTAFVLVTGLLHDNLDDKIDTIRGALEIDPLLAAWAVCTAKKHNNAKLFSMDSACRWLATSLLTVVNKPSQLLQQQSLPAATRSAWRNITVTAIATGRKAHQNSASHSKQAFWLAAICRTKAELDAYSKLNGHSPMHGFSLAWPKWVSDFEKSIAAADATQSVAATVRDALAADEAALSDLVHPEERELWFRQYPEFLHLAPLLMKKLQRLNDLEERFDETLQHEKLASLQQLAYGASHEINNPLANISTRAQTLVYHEHDADRRKKLFAINDQAFRAYEMIADLMLFAKPPQLEIVEEVSIPQVLNGVRDELREKAAAQDTMIQIRIAHVMVDCSADPTQLAVAIKAMCLNGLEAITSGGQLTLEASINPQTKCVEIAIEDNGEGLSESARRHLFDPFYSGREAGRGLGFGLSKAWRIVDQHHGRITVDSQPGRGSRFTIVLPLANQRGDKKRARSPARIHEQRQNNPSLSE